jgi:hypothetical protein
MRLGEALDETATAALRHVASAHGLRCDDSTTRTELIERLAERLTDAAYLDEQINGLGPDERAVLDLARAHAAGEVRGLLADRDHPGAAEALVERGLLFRLFAAAGPLRGEVFAASDELLARLPPPPVDAGPPLSAAAPAASERRTSDPAFSLFCLASVLGRRGADLEADVRAWTEEPGGWGWDARWSFLRHLAQASGLFVRQADGALSTAGLLPRLLDEPRAFFDRLWRAYVRDRGWSELAQIGIEADLANSIQLRAALIQALEALPEGTWIAIDVLSAWLRRTRPSLVREQLSPRGLVLLDSRDWEQLELPLLKAWLLGPLYWLGVVGATLDGAQVVRRPPPEARAAEPCYWATQAELVAAPRAALGTLLRAERYLVVRERGRPSRYHLVQAHVAAALSGGGSLGECRHLLTRLTQKGLPAAVAERLAAWERRFGALSIRPAVLLEARTDAELDAALEHEQVRAFLRARLSPTVAEVAAADALELAAVLRGSDHLPRLDAALRLAGDARGVYAGLVDEQVLEFLLVSLLAFQRARPEQLNELEGAQPLLERLERQFPPERLRELHRAAAGLAGELGPRSRPRPRRGARASGARRRPTA